MRNKAVINRPMLDRLMQSIKDSLKFHEYKLFFILSHFDLLDIRQLNQLIDIFLLIF